MLSTPLIRPITISMLRVLYRQIEMLEKNELSACIFSRFKLTTTLNADDVNKARDSDSGMPARNRI